MAPNGRITGEKLSGREFDRRGLSEVSARNLLGSTEENHETSVRLTGITPDSRSKHLRNTNPEPHHFSTLLCALL
jgi:hypothetical protein